MLQRVSGLTRGLLYLTMMLLMLFTVQEAKGANSTMAERVNLARGLSYWVSQPAHSNYPDVGRELTDGSKGSGTNLGDSAWQGHLRDEFRVITLDLGAPKPVDRVSIGFLNENSSGIFLPDQVMVSTSVNGKDWTEPVAIRKPELGPLNTPARKEVTFPDLGATARYVRIVFFVEVWVFVDEVEVWGEDRVVDVDGPTDLLDMNDPYLGLNTQGAAAWRADRLPEHTTDAYFPPGSPAAAGVRHMMLIYTHADWGLTEALPYVAYSQRDDSKPFAPAQWEDWFFDSFLFLALVTPDRKNAFDSASRSAPATWEHWSWFLDYLFRPDQQLDAFNKAVARAKSFIDDPDYKAKVVVMIPYPIPSTTDFGDPLGTGESLSFTAFPQGIEAQKAARFGAVEAYVKELYRRWDAHEFEHLEFVGLYWLAELIEGRADVELLQDVANLVHERDHKFFWIPYYSATGWAQWEDAGFDAAIYQPNYMFNVRTPLSQLKEAAERAHRYGMGVEIEADETVLTSASGRERYLAYLRAGVEYGFMNEAIHGYYQGMNVLQRAFVDRDPAVRHLYDATYQYVKGTYDPDGK